MKKISMVVWLLLLSSCGEISYKRGASGEEYTKAQHECAQATEGVANCMQNKGWQKPSTDVLDPLFASINHQDNRSISEKVIGNDKPTESTDSVVKNAQLEHAPASTTAEKHPVNMATATPTISAQASKTVNDSDDTTYKINSWWKRGGFPDQLNQDQKTCEKKLDAAYTPDYKSRTFKRLFVKCMHDFGWMAIREPN